jgi:hypothetical protein
MKDPYFVGRLYAFDKKTEDANVSDERVVCELTEVSHEGIEIAFDDRNERMYLKFRISDLARAVESRSGDGT